MDLEGTGFCMWIDKVSMGGLTAIITYICLHTVWLLAQGSVLQ